MSTIINQPQQLQLNCSDQMDISLEDFSRGSSPPTPYSNIESIESQSNSASDTNGTQDSSTSSATSNADSSGGETVQGWMADLVLQQTSAEPEPKDKEDGEVEEEDDHMFSRNPTRWVFSKEYLLNETPSRKAGIPADKELLYRQEAAGFIYVMGERLKVKLLVTNTAMVFMHRFYMLHPFIPCLHWKPLSMAALLLACKVEEENRSDRHIASIAYRLLFDEVQVPYEKDPKFERLIREMLEFENLLIATLGFELQIEHPHHYVATFSMSMNDAVGTMKDFLKACYLMATNSLLYTTLNLELSPTIIACICINACAKKWKLEIPIKNGLEWFKHIEPKLTLEVLEKHSIEFVKRYKSAPAYMNMKKKMSVNNSPPKTNGCSPPGAPGIQVNNGAAASLCSPTGSIKYGNGIKGINGCSTKANSADTLNSNNFPLQNTSQR